MRASAATFLVQLRVPQLLLPAFNDSTPAVRLIAVDGVAQLIDEIGAANQHSTSPDGTFLRASSRVDLRRCIMAALLQLLADNERQVRAEAAMALQLLGDDDWLPAFPTADGPPSFIVLADSERPEVMWPC